MNDKCYTIRIPFLIFFVLVTVQMHCRSNNSNREELIWWQCTSDFESGSGTDFHLREDGAIGFSVPNDPGSGEYLWFYFKLFSSTQEPVEFVLENAAGAHQTGIRWEITRPVFSADGQAWVRALETNYNGTVFRFQAPIVANTLWVAYCYPYTSRDLKSFLETIRNLSDIRISVLGESQEGRDIMAIHVIRNRELSLTSASQPLIWIIGREHPGETPLSYVCEGIIEALLYSTAGEQLRQVFDFIIVPTVNVDGVFLGYYYHNAGGVNLAWDWVAFESPEARVVRDSLVEDMQTQGVRLLMNLHSANDPTKGHFFLVIPEENLSYEDRQLQMQILQAAQNVHPQLQSYSTLNLLPDPGITGNALYNNYDLYNFYLESNYSRGADGSIVTQQTLREVGAALVEVLSMVLITER